MTGVSLTSVIGRVSLWIYSRVLGLGDKVTRERYTLSTDPPGHSITTVLPRTLFTLYGPSTTAASFWRCSHWSRRSMRSNNQSYGKSFSGFRRFLASYTMYKHYNASWNGLVTDRFSSWFAVMLL